MSLSKFDKFSFDDVGVKLPDLPTVENVENFLNLKCVCKFRHHETGWEWYVIAGNKTINQDMMLYCFVRGLEDELGNVMLSEILDVGAMFCPTFQPCRVGDVLD